MGDFKPTSSVVITDTSGNSITVTSGIGMNTVQAGTTVRAGATAVSDASGGVALGSGKTAFGIQVKTVSGVVIWVGGAPFSGVGYPLYSGQNLTVAASNLNQVRIVGAVSGTVVNYIGVDV